jgi:hypothetical protein
MEFQDFIIPQNVIKVNDETLNESLAQKVLATA